MEKKVKEMKGSTFKANKRGEEGGEFSAEAWEAEWPGRRDMGVRWETFVRTEQLTALNTNDINHNTTDFSCYCCV